MNSTKEKYDMLFTLDSKDMFSVHWTVWLRAKKSIAVYYEIITWGDSGDSNDYEEEKGEEDTIDCVPDRWDIEENLTAVNFAIDKLKGNVAEPSSNQFHSGVWYTGYREQNFRTGWDTTLSYHLQGFTVEEQEAVYNAVMRKKQ